MNQTDAITFRERKFVLISDDWLFQSNLAFASFVDVAFNVTTVTCVSTTDGLMFFFSVFFFSFLFFLVPSLSRTASSRQVLPVRGLT